MPSLPSSLSCLPNFPVLAYHSPIPTTPFCLSSFPLPSSLSPLPTCPLPSYGFPLTSFASHFLIPDFHFPIPTSHFPLLLLSAAALWFGTAWFPSINHSLSNELGSEWVSERANKWAQRSTRAKRVVRSKQMISVASERANRRASGPVLTSRFMAVLDHCAASCCPPLEGKTIFISFYRINSALKHIPAKPRTQKKSFL